MSTDPGGDLRSYQFRKEREANWRELEGLARRIERGRVRSLSFEEAARLPHLYRGVLSSLSVARAISLDKGLLAYLDSLAARAYMAVYGSRETFTESFGRFYGRQFPGAVRASVIPILLSALFLFLGVFAGYWIVATDPERYFLIIPEYLSQGRTPFADPELMRRTIYNDNTGELSELTGFATQLFAHNSAVGIFAFALGFAATVPTALLLFYNGLSLGAMIRAFDVNGLGYDFIAWLSIHGTTELFAIILCGAAGFVIGASIIFPGRYTRMDNLALNGRRAGLLIVGAVSMLFFAGFLEGVGRQTVQSAELRLLIGGGFLTFWIFYFARAGRS